jgi:hypothetical protein
MNDVVRDSNLRAGADYCLCDLPLLWCDFNNSILIL